MEILKDIFAEDLFLYLKKHNTLLLSDIHIGYEEMLNASGILIPRNNHLDLKIRLEKTLYALNRKNAQLEYIIINGDLLHSFSKITLDERYILKDILECLNKYGKIIIIKGNHDKVLEFLINKNVVFTKEAILGDILITHGDVINKHSNDKRIKTIVVGHEHPSIILDSGIRKEKFKCLLVGKYKNKNLIVTPSCNILVEGSDVLREKILSPYIKNVLEFNAFIVEDKIYDFGKLKKLKRN